MARRGDVKCRACKEVFNRIDTQEHTYWIQSSPKYYYHKECYEKWKNIDTKEEDKDFIEMIYYLIRHELKEFYTYHQIETQRKKFLMQNMTNKGIYFSLLWFFSIQKGNKWNPDYGIGIVPSIYKRATDYWADKEKKNKGILKQIERMTREKIDKESLVIKKKKTTKKKKIKAPE